MAVFLGSFVVDCASCGITLPYNEVRRGVFYCLRRRAAVCRQGNIVSRIDGGALEYGCIMRCTLVFAGIFWGVTSFLREEYEVQSPSVLVKMPAPSFLVHGVLSCYIKVVVLMWLVSIFV